MDPSTAPEEPAQSIVQQKSQSGTGNRAKYFRVETNSYIEPYVVRDHAWNHDEHDATNFYDYEADTPDGYKEHMKFSKHPTNRPKGGKYVPPE